MARAKYGDGARAIVGLGRTAQVVWMAHPVQDDRLALPSTRMRSTSHTVVITGAASGLGRALAHAYRRRGCALALIDVDGEGLQALQAAFGPTGPLVTVHRADVASEVEMAAAHTAILAAHGTVDRVINNAGISISRPFVGTITTDERHLFDVNY